MIQNGKRKHPVTAIEQAFFPFAKALQYHFSVRIASEGFAFGFQFFTYHAVIIDLTVIYDGIIAFFSSHRLMPGRRKIQNRKASVAETAVQSVDCSDPGACIIRAAMTQHISHRGQGFVISIRF